jgi:hypothetical protein
MRDGTSADWKQPYIAARRDEYATHGFNKTEGTIRSYLSPSGTPSLEFLAATAHLLPHGMDALLGLVAGYEASSTPAELADTRDAIRGINRKCPGCGALRVTFAESTSRESDANATALSDGLHPAPLLPAESDLPTGDDSSTPSDDTPGRLFIITAISGMSVNTVLSKCLKTSDGTRDRVIVKLDAYVTHFATQYLKDPTDDVSFRDILPLPPRILRACVRQALEPALSGGHPSLAHLKSVIPALTAGKDVFLTLHASWYSGMHHGFINSINACLLAEHLRSHGLRVSRVIMLVDDIWDIIARLMRQSYMFDQHHHRVPTEDDIAGNEVLKSAPQVSRPITPNLVKLTQWRQHEFDRSQEIAEAVPRADDSSAETLVFAVKQPVSTFQKLLEQPTANITYLSISVAEPYKLSKPDRLARIDFVNRVIRQLRRKDDVTLLEPISVDELRIMRDTDDDDDYIGSSELRERWPVPALDQKDQLLADGFLDDSDEAFFVQYPFLGRDDTGEHLALLRRLLHDMVIARNRVLVGQANGVVLLRPFTRRDSAASEGMQIAAVMNEQLRQFDEQSPDPGERRRRKTVVYHPRGDEQLRRQAAVTLVLQREYAAAKIDGLWQLLAVQSDMWTVFEEWRAAARTPDIAQQVVELIGEPRSISAFRKKNPTLDEELRTRKEDVFRKLGDEVQKAVRGDDLVGDEYSLSFLGGDYDAETVISGTIDDPETLADLVHATLRILDKESGPTPGA